MNWSIVSMLGSLARFKWAYWRGSRPPAPINLTFSTTNLCQSKCKSCNIWRYYRDDPAWFKQELSIDEIEKTFRSIGPVYFFNISGGEPFLRTDLVEIVRLSLRHLRPRVVHCPTNVLCPSRVISGTREILETIATEAPGTPFTIKPSFDGVGAMHDEIRGVKGNYDRLLTAVQGLKDLKREFPNLSVGLGTVVSRMNVAHLSAIHDEVERIGVDTYITEVAEHRSEMKNLSDPITPAVDDYEKAIRRYKERQRARLGSHRGLARVTQALRILYYDLAVGIMREKRQVIPCYGGISNAHLSPYGDVWPCAVLGYEHSLGNVREHGHDFWKVWHSERAAQVRQYIKERRCACPLANQSYANLLLHGPSLARAAWMVVHPGPPDACAQPAGQAPPPAASQATVSPGSSESLAGAHQGPGPRISR